MSSTGEFDGESRAAAHVVLSLQVETQANPVLAVA